MSGFLDLLTGLSAGAGQTIQQMRAEQRKEEDEALNRQLDLTKLVMEHPYASDDVREKAFGDLITLTGALGKPRQSAGGLAGLRGARKMPSFGLIETLRKSLEPDERAGAPGMGRFGIREPIEAPPGGAEAPRPPGRALLTSEELMRREAEMAGLKAEATAGGEIAGKLRAVKQALGQNTSGTPGLDPFSRDLLGLPLAEEIKEYVIDGRVFPGFEDKLQPGVVTDARTMKPVPGASPLPPNARGALNEREMMVRILTGKHPRLDIIAPQDWEDADRALRDRNLADRVRELAAQHAATLKYLPDEEAARQKAQTAGAYQRQLQEILPPSQLEAFQPSERPAFGTTVGQAAGLVPAPPSAGPRVYTEQEQRTVRSMNTMDKAVDTIESLTNEVFSGAGWAPTATGEQIYQKFQQAVRSGWSREYGSKLRRLRATIKGQLTTAARSLGEDTANIAVPEADRLLDLFPSIPGGINPFELPDTHQTAVDVIANLRRLINDKRAQITGPPTQSLDDFLKLKRR